jgi:hypothetical protein
MRLLSIFFVLPIFISHISCSSKSNGVNIQFNGSLTLIDSTIHHHGKLLHYDSSNIVAYFPIYYIGERKDTISLPKVPISTFYVKGRDAKYDTAKNWASYPNMTIVVDTSFHLIHTSHFGHYNNNSEEIIDSVVYYQAFPVFLYSHSDSLLLVGSHNIVRWMITETQNQNGDWIEIEEPIRDLCGTGQRDIVLEPHCVLVAKVLRYSDAGKTLRLKFKHHNAVIYSNTF